MKRVSLVSRSLRFHWRTHLAVMLGVAAGSAALTGALLVGDSMRGSLRETALGRLGRVDHALLGSRFFQTELAAKLAVTDTFSETFAEVAPIINLSGSIAHANQAGLVNRIQILGVDDRFWAMRSHDVTWPVPHLIGRTVALTEHLARELQAEVGDDVLLRVGKPRVISTETILGRRDDATTSLRLTVKAILPPNDLGVFSLNPRQRLPRNAYLPLRTLQRALNRVDRASSLLVAARTDTTKTIQAQIKTLDDLINQHLELEDLGLTLRVNDKLGYVSLESDAMLIDPGMQRVALLAAAESGGHATSVITYLANEIRIDRSNPTATRTMIPYSTVSAIDPSGPIAKALRSPDGSPIPKLRNKEVLLNSWAAEQLGVGRGDRITLTYYISGPMGKLETRASTFTLANVIDLSGAAADRGFTPDYPGVTDTENLADWDPPFPVNLKLVKDEDEVYWDLYRATPKAFITLDDGQRLWAQEADRFGTYTSIRLYPDAQQTVFELAASFERQLKKRTIAREHGLAFEAVRQRLEHAGEGTTDFGMLFIGFSMFLIASSSMLVALLFRLTVERRSKEPGLLRALGWSDKIVTRWLIAEGVMVAIAGAVPGLVGALGYAWLMLLGLKTWWADAANTPFLELHVSSTSIVIGFVASVAIGVGSMALSIRGLSRYSVRALLAGAASRGIEPLTAHGGRTSKVVASGALMVSIITGVLPGLTDSVPQAPLFFLSGGALLTFFIAIFSLILHRQRGKSIPFDRARALAGLSFRNASRNTRRSMLTVGLIASASFLVVALQAFQLQATNDVHDRSSGTGGFSLYAESAVPLVYDLNLSEGRESLNMDPEASAKLVDLNAIPFRLRPGDEASCLNLYRPTKPRILAATDRMIKRGGFTFKSSLAQTDAERENPWLLLGKKFSDGAIPVIGDEAAVLWQFHSGLGKDLSVTNESGQLVTLRFVAMLAGSFLQDELIIPESSFVRMFPSIDGYAFFLIETPADQVQETARLLEKELAPFGFDAGRSAQRLAAYMAVQNTYLSTFQMLGGFGLILGTLGLTAVMLRNVWERRGELALMRALGFSRSNIGRFLLYENVALLSAGLCAGLVSAALAIAPHLISRPGSIAWAPLVGILLLVWLVGLAASILAAISATRAPLVHALRAE